MRTADMARLAGSAVTAHRLRSALTTLGIAIGIFAVVLLTSIGEGIHRFVMSEFTQFGTNIIGINPGKATTMGASIGVFGSVRPLSIDDAEALRRLPYVESVVAMVQGNAEIEFGRLQRRTTVYGVSPDFPQAFQFNVASGSFLPPDDPRNPRAVAVLGSKLANELFSKESPVGARIRVGGDRYRVVGVMEPKGTMLGFDLDDTIFVPASRGLDLFGREGLMEIDILYAENAPVDELVSGIKRLLIARHGGEDVTITTQQQMMDVLGSVLGVLTFAVGALGGISLLVGGVGIFSIMTISVSERTSEVGLLRALGASKGQILTLFLGEAILLAAAGGFAGLVVGWGGAWMINQLIPSMPVHTPLYFVFLAEFAAILIGLLAGVAPARRAAAMIPVEALRTE
ncbi:MAG: ABC transporter permease [Gammaproteobacteria bacterium]|nr:ABC transporter permease [Gammaproteobacteria bacterium]